MPKQFMPYDLYERHHVIGKWQCWNLERLITRQGNAWIKRYVDWNSEALFHPIRLTTQPYDRANRFYLYAEKRA